MNQRTPSSVEVDEAARTGIENSEATRSYLLTGGAGFIGSYIAERLVALGNSVTVLDDLSTGFKENIPDGADLVLGDVADAGIVHQAFETAHPDTVLHLAAQVSNIVSHRDPWRDVRTNVGGTINVLAAAERFGAREIIYASSMAIYGSPGDKPVCEATRVDPSSPYGVSKLAAEQLIHNAARRRDTVLTKVASLRMFNVFGPRQSLSNPYQGVASVFIANVLNNEPITLFGDGEQSRDFVFIDDVVEAWMKALDADINNVRVNIGTGCAVSVNDLLDAVLAAFGTDRTRYPIRHEPELLGDQRVVRADASLAEDTLGWSAKVPFQNGLHTTVEWAKEAWSLSSNVS